MILTDAAVPGVPLASALPIARRIILAGCFFALATASAAAQTAATPPCAPMTYFGVTGCAMPASEQCPVGYQEQAVGPTNPAMKAPTRLMCVADHAPADTPPAASPNASAAAPDAEFVSDTNIHVVHFEPMTYPPLAKTAAIHGLVVIRVKLDDEGNVTAAEAISGNEIFVPGCLTNIKKWRFRANAERAAVIVYNFSNAELICKDDRMFSKFSFQNPNLAIIKACATLVSKFFSGSSGTTLAGERFPPKPANDKIWRQAP